MLSSFFLRIVLLSAACLTLVACSDSDQGTDPVENFVYSMGSVVPDPVSDSALMEFSLGESVHTLITVENVTGATVHTYIDSHLEQGRYSVTIDASGMPDGLYHIRMIAGRWREVRQFRVVH